MRRIPYSRSTPSQPQTGHILWADTGDGVDLWMLFPERTGYGMVAALILGQPSEIPLPGWHSCVIDPEQLKEKAERALKDWKKQPISITSVGGEHVLWLRLEEDSTWLCLGVLEYGAPPSGHRFPVRWLKISNPDIQTQGLLQEPETALDSDNLPPEVEQILKEATSWTGQIEDVDCLVTLDEKERVFKVIFERRSDGRCLAIRTMSRTDKLLHLLRCPLTEGAFPETNEGILMRWNHLSDVQYDDVSLKRKNGEWLSLTFLKPLVQSPRFLSDCYSIPQSCDALLKTRLGDDITLAVDIDERDKRTGSKSFLRARVIGVADTSGLRRLESSPLRLFEVAMLAECEQIVDMDRRMRHAMTLDVRNLLKLRISSWYSRFERFHDALRAAAEEVAAETEFIEEREIETTEKVSLFDDEVGVVGMDLYESGREKRLVVDAVLSPVKDMESQATIRVFEIRALDTKEPVEYEYVAWITTQFLKEYDFERDLVDEIVDRICDKLEEEGLPVTYD